MKRLTRTLPLFALLAATLLANVAAAQQAVNIYFCNQSSAPARVEWLHGNARQFYMTVAPGQTRSLQSYIGHNWSFACASGQAAVGGKVTHANQVYTLGGQTQQPFNPPIQPHVNPVDTPAKSSLNQAVLNYARNSVGRRLGNGQCTELAVAALRNAGARYNGGYAWGRQLGSLQEVQPGDIMQMWNLQIRMPNGASQWSTGPHTAVVTGVQGNVVYVLEQNISGSPVQAGQYDLRYLTGGSIAYYRPVSGGRAIGGTTFPPQNPGQFGPGVSGGDVLTTLLSLLK